MKVNIGTFEIPDVVRRALRAHRGKPGLATREEVRSYIRMTMSSVLGDVTHEFRTDYPEQAKKLDDAEPES